MNQISRDIHLCETSQCTGCMACMQKCKAGAIGTKTIDGFWYPVIDEDKCKKCAQCMEVCPVLNLKNTKGNCHENTDTCLAAWNKRDEIRKKSSSGGVFSVFAEQTLSSKGVVFGAAWNSKMELEHKYIEDVSELESIRRSKYVQSNTGNTFNQVENFLKEGRKVLYCGTPCQIAGLKSFLVKDYENLMLIDILCQGVPSQELFKTYIKEIEIKYNSKIVDANFRTKKKGWRCGLLLLLLLLENGKEIRCALDNNEYYNAFFREFFCRPSCYSCNFKKQKLGYYSDITIADFWRIGNKIPLPKVVEQDYTKGISAIVVNTEKGKRFLDACSDRIGLLERTWNEFSTNGGLYPSPKPSRNDEAKHYLENHSWRETQQKFFPMSRRKKISNLLMLTIGERYIRRVKKFLGRL
ncbi:Coenzyme F420 hydrogenase/dehydrogenase, beta subunit C-terminal domain [uncultured Fibrobacter sp.]|uniref:Coenzyme F420 hydrogenase/dehydrogenase, beta subunit C-terminal domain n=1 Tax=uncultured Fibrobacter sp. TaxID=261512 RepID=UPI0025ED7139|nr:Coenzyme F420 hydrogenase/dehydrogenase, beta subunit C-terminal domain [uncultured Fibrobacter sp.]